MLWNSIETSILAQGVSNKAAIISDEGELTYGELLVAVHTLANDLKVIGVGQGHVVLTCLDNVPAFLVAILASAHLGADRLTDVYIYIYIYIYI